ncbi:MAG: ABC transporter permease [Gemmatimonadetes bacterium]|nr:ABC transporter permease [Gemmatimonadota bacterium]
MKTIMTVLRDLRYGIRMLFKNPALSLIAIITFGLGIGLTTTVFSIVNGAILKGLPFDRADELMALGRANPSQDIRRMGVSSHDFVDWSEQQSVFEELAAFSGLTINLIGDEDAPVRYAGARLTTNTFDLLGVSPHIGRGFSESESREGFDDVIILSYRAWESQFGADSAVLGRSVTANGVPATVIGVMPSGIRFPNDNDVWMPLVIDPLANPRGEGPNYFAFARLRDGVSREEAEAHMATIAQRLAVEYPESNEGVIATVTPYVERFIGSEAYALLYTMLGAVIGVLLIASVNVANLLLARASTRTKEVAVRTALGASRRRVIGQLLIETLVLATVGSALGLGVGYFGIEWFDRAISVDPPPFWMVFELDTDVLIFVGAMTLLTSLFAGIAPALQATGTDINEVLKAEGRGASSFRMGKFSGALVITEIAISCALLVAAGLMVKSITQLKTVDMPFAVDDVFTARLNLPRVEYPDTASRTRFYEQLLPRLQAIPGVLGATLSDGLPASGNGLRVFEVPGGSYAEDSDFPRAREGIVTPGYFQTFDTRVLQGRAFTESDRMNTLRVAVVNASFVAQFYPDGDPLGQQMRMGRRDTTASWLTVVGVVPDMLMQGIDDPDDDPAGFYIPIAQSGVGNFVSIAVRTQGNPMTRTAEVQSAVRAIDTNLPIYRVMSMQGVIDRETWFYGVFGTLFGLFGLVALFLAAVGLYGVMSFAVTRRTQEMGVRLALGAQGSSLVKLIMKKGIIQLGVGMVIGLVLAVLIAGPIEIVLYDVDGRDPVVFAIVLVTLTVTSLAATFVPALRVTRVDPVNALRSE